jgi:hypothetical protein
MKTVDEVVSAFGGPAATAKVFGVVPSAVSNWKNARRFPARLHFKILREAQARGLVVDDSVFDPPDRGGQ